MVTNLIKVCVKICFTETVFESFAHQVIPPESEAKQTSLSSSSSSQTTGRKRRRNRWSDAPSALDPNQTEDERAIAAAMASFSTVATPMSQNTTQHSLTPAQLQQMKEQIEVIIIFFFFFCNVFIIFLI